MHKLRYPSRRVTGASAYSTVKIRLKFKGYSLRNWLKGYQFRPVQRFRCCAHTTPHHYPTCKNDPLVQEILARASALDMQDTVEVRNLPAAKDGWVPIGYTEDGGTFFAAPKNTPARSVTVTGMQISPEGLEILTGCAPSPDTRDDLDPIPSEFPVSERWADIRRKAHPDAGE